MNPHFQPVRRVKTNHLGAFVLKRRTELGLTQREVAKALKLASVEFIGLVERGSRQPHYERLPALAKVLDTTLHHLFELAIRDACPVMARVLFGVPPPPALQPRTLGLLLKIEALDPSGHRRVVCFINKLYRGA